MRNNPLDTLGTVPVTETYEYKGLGGRPTRVDTVIGSTASFAGGTFALDQTWNALGLLDSVTYPTTPAVSGNARTISYSYSQGLLTGVAGYATLTYQANGLLNAVTHGTGSAAVTETWTADPNGMSRPAGIVVKRGTETLWNSGNYAYDGAGNITAIGNLTFTYDALNRLVAWTTTKPAGGYDRVTRKLDPFGNYAGSKIDGCTSAASTASCYSTSATPLAVNSSLNRYTGSTYDAAGSVLSDGRYTYAYDGAAMMQSLTGSGRNERYLYTADDERVAIVDLAASGKTTWTLRGTGHQLLRTFTRNGTAANSAWGWTEDEIWRGAQLLASESPSGRKQHHLDHLGSPRLITNSSGQRLGEQSFTPFGMGGTLDGGRLQFTGHERDVPSQGGVQETLDYMHARYYSAAMGRFLSVDPIIDVQAAMHNPQMWNRYSYVANNPINRIDPTGKLGCKGEAGGGLLLGS